MVDATAFWKINFMCTLFLINWNFSLFTPARLINEKRVIAARQLTEFAAYTAQDLAQFKRCNYKLQLKLLYISVDWVRIYVNGVAFVSPLGISQSV